MESAELNSGDTAWMLAATALVLFMTLPGIALFYGGMVRRGGGRAMLAQVLTVGCLVSVLWMVIGYGIAFPASPSASGVGQFLQLDVGQLALWGTASEDVHPGSTIPVSVFIMFQLTFAVITAALICGAVADRMRFLPLLFFLGLWSVLVYAPVCYWVWGGGFLGQWGVLDFAGGKVVHISSGVSGLVAASMVGKRLDYAPPNNLVYTLIGTAMLWVGWCGFNAGSALAANAQAGMAILVTHLAAASGALAWMICEWSRQRGPNLLGVMSGAVAGLVAITPAAGFVGPQAAVLIGAAGGGACLFFSTYCATYVKNRLKWDDALDVFGIHGVAGIVGALLTGVFASAAFGGSSGLLDGNPYQMVPQLIGIVVVGAYCALMSFLILKALGRFMSLRVTEKEEIEGLDSSLYGRFQ